jgi:hypothetical protein
LSGFEISTVLRPALTATLLNASGSPLPRAAP